MKTSTKTDLVDAVQRQLATPNKDAQEITDALFELLKSNLEKGLPIKLPGFGIFSVLKKRERQGRNPKTGEVMPITARKVVTFKASPMLKERIQKNK